MFPPITSPSDELSFGKLYKAPAKYGLYAFPAGLGASPVTVAVLDDFDIVCPISSHEENNRDFHYHWIEVVTTKGYGWLFLPNSVKARLIRL